MDVLFHSTILIETKPLPKEVAELLEKNVSLLRTLNTFNKASLEGKNHHIREDKIIELRDLKSKLNAAFLEYDEAWKGAVDEILCFGPRRHGPNILLNHVGTYQNRGSVWTLIEGGKLTTWPSDSNIISGFQMSTQAGPLCREPMRGVCYVLKEWTIEKTLRYGVSGRELIIIIAFIGRFLPLLSRLFHIKGFAYV